MNPTMIDFWDWKKEQYQTMEIWMLPWSTAPRWYVRRPESGNQRSSILAPIEGWVTVRRNSKGRMVLANAINYFWRWSATEYVHFFLY
jgi:hypothetical protein